MFSALCRTLREAPLLLVALTVVAVAVADTAVHKEACISTA
jgi:hypothetical protein